MKQKHFRNLTASFPRLYNYAQKWRKSTADIADAFCFSFVKTSAKQAQNKRKTSAKHAQKRRASFPLVF